VKRWDVLIDQVAGGDADLEANLNRNYGQLAALFASGAGSAEVSPLHPSQTPPVRAIAAVNPTARPPEPASLPGTEMRFETQTSRFTDNDPYSAPQDDRARMRRALSAIE
jgi:hypothetical protein